MKNQAKLKNWGLKEKYYYLRFGKGAENVPDGFLGVATVCIMPGNLVPDAFIGDNSVEGWHYVRGVSFCNPKDQFNKKTGRAIALGRAIKAIESHHSSDSIHRTTPVFILAQSQGWVYLSAWNIGLTEYEQRLFRSTGTVEQLFR